MGQLPQVTFSLSDGNLGRTAITKDEISGFVFYNDNVADLTGITAAANVVKFTNLGSLETAGFTETSTNFKTEWYMLSEYFRMGGGDVWVGVFPVPAGSYDYTELTTMNNTSAGEIRQYGINSNLVRFNTTDISTVNTLIDGFWDEKKPSIAIMGFDYSGETTLAGFDDLRALASNAPYVSVVLGSDTENMPDTLSATTSLPNIGAVLGAISSAKVQTNILYVNQFNYTDGTQMVTPGIRFSGTTINSIKLYDDSDLDLLNDKGYIFWRYFANLSGTYLSNDHNCTVLTSDFSSIHNNRVMGKVIRDVDTNVTPLVGGEVILKEGLLTASSLNVFKNAASSPLSVMESNGEISSFSVFIDKTQNVSSTNTITIQISIVPVFSADTITIELGFSTT